MFALIYRREVVSISGIAVWEYRGRYLDGVSSDWVTEAEFLGGFTPLQLDTFHVRWNLNPPDAEKPQTTVRPKKRTLLSRSEALTLYPTETTVTRSHEVGDKRTDRVGQVYNVIHPTGALGSRTTTGKS